MQCKLSQHEYDYPCTHQHSLVMDPISESAKQLGLQKLKEKQLEAVSSFVQGHDTFVSLPTGYGKSVIYAILPYVFDQLKGTGCMV